MLVGEDAVAFTVEDFQDLVRLLEQRPEWRAQLRRLLLPEELLELPAVVRQLAEEVRALAEAQRRTEAAVAELADAQRRTEARLDRFDVRFDRIDAQFDRIDTRLDRLEDHVADLRGSDLERRYREHAHGYFGAIIRRVRVVGPEELDDLLEAGLAAGALDEAAAGEVRLADLIMRGQRPGEDWETYLVLEVSTVVDTSDVERAVRRASLLGHVRPALAAVAGIEATPEAATLARNRAVWRVENGRVQPPDGQ